MPSEKRSSLSGIELFRPLSEPEILNLERRVPSVGLQEGQVLYTPWHRGESFFLLLEGRIRIYRVRRAREMTLSVKHPGDFFGEAALAGLRQGSWAQALEPAKVAIMSHRALKSLVAEIPEVSAMLIELLIERLSLYEDKLEEVGLKEIQARLASLLARMIESEGASESGGYVIPEHYTHQLLATMIGCERPALTRALRELREAEAIWLSGRRIHVTNLESLKSFTEID